MPGWLDLATGCLAEKAKAYGGAIKGCESSADCHGEAYKAERKTVQASCSFTVWAVTVATHKGGESLYEERNTL